MDSRRMQHDLLIHSGFHFPVASLLSPQVEDFDAFEDRYEPIFPYKDEVDQQSGLVKGEEEKPGFRIVFNVACLKEDMVSLQFPDDSTLVFKVNEKFCRMGTNTFARCCDHQYKLPKGVVRDDLMAIWTEDDYLVIYEKEKKPDFEWIGSEDMVSKMKKRMAKRGFKVLEDDKKTEAAKELSNGSTKDVPEETKEATSNHKLKRDASKDSETIDSVSEGKEKPRDKLSRESSKDITEEMKEAVSSPKLTRDASKDSEKSSVFEGKEKPRGKLTRESSIDSGMSSQPLTRHGSKDEEMSLDSQKDEDSTTDSYKLKTAEDDATSDSVKSESKASTTNGTEDEEAKIEQKAVSGAELKVEQKSTDEPEMERKPSPDADPKVERKSTEPDGKSTKKDSAFKIRWEDVDGGKRLHPIRLSWRLKPLFEPKQFHSMISEMESQVQSLKLMVQNDAFLTANTHALIHAKIKQDVAAFKKEMKKKEMENKNAVKTEKKGDKSKEGLQTSERDGEKDVMTVEAEQEKTKDTSEE